MVYKIDYWDESSQSQKQRDATSAEIAEIEARRAAAPPGIPQQVPMRNARLALYSAGLLKQVEQYIGAMDGVEGDLARIDWATAMTVRRDSPLVAKLMSVLNLSASAIDTLFISAAALA